MIYDFINSQEKWMFFQQNVQKQKEKIIYNNSSIFPDDNKWMCSEIGH